VYKRIKYKGVSVGVDEEFVCDTQSDLASLPTDSAQGSSAFVIEDSSTWMINSSGQWIQTIISGGGDISTQRLSVSQNGTYISPAGTAYNRVVVDVTGRPDIEVDEDTHVIVHVDSGPEERRTISLSWSQTVSEGVTVNWGDGSAAESYSVTGSTTQEHVYENPGDYEIVMKVVSGELSFPGTSGTSGTALYGSKTNQNSYNRTRITAVSIGGDASSVGAYMLQHCYSVRGVFVADGIETVGDGAFYSCHTLRSVVLPEGLTSVGDSAFYYCYALDDINIPSTVTSIGAHTFYNCFALKGIELPSGIDEISDYMFYGCYNLDSIDIPSGVSSIGDGAFGNCYALSTVTIPATVTTIENDAFGSCYGIMEYHLKPTTPPTLRNTGAFSGMSSDCVIYVPYSANHSILNAYKAATNWSSFASKMREEAAS